MNYLLCRNRVADYEEWRAVFDSHAEAHREAGLQMLHRWRAFGDPDNVFFLFAVTDLDSAQEFMGTSEAAAAAETSGQQEAEYHFLEAVPGY